MYVTNRRCNHLHIFCLMLHVIVKVGEEYTSNYSNLLFAMKLQQIYISWQNVIVWALLHRHTYTVFDSIGSELDFGAINNRLLLGLKLCASFLLFLRMVSITMLPGLMPTGFLRVLGFLPVVSLWFCTLVITNHHNLNLHLYNL